MKGDRNNGILDKGRACLKNMKWWHRLICVLLIAVLGGSSFEALYGMNIRRKVKEDGFEPKVEGIPETCIGVENGERSGDGIYIVEENGRLIITFPARFVDKFQYTYDAENDFSTEIEIQKQDAYGNFFIETITDLSRKNLSESVVNINGVIQSIALRFPKRVEVSGFALNNKAESNGYRRLYVTVFLALLLLIIVFRKEYARRVEFGFLTLALGVGMLMIAIQPTQFMGWDEHIHFSSVFDFFEKGEVTWSEAEYYQYMYPETLNSSPFASKEEKAQQILWLNEMGKKESSYQYTKSGFSLSQMGYVHMAVVVAVGRALNLPFYYLLLLGKITNLMLYSIVIFFAIRIVPIRKRLLAAAALMPTPIVLAAAYSYDPVTIAFIFLGTALLVREFCEPQKKIEYRSFFGIVICFLYGSFSKAVYIPLILSILLLPGEKYKSRKQRCILNGIVLVCCVLLMLSFMLPASGQAEGDARVANTSVSSQLQVILTNPLAYISVLCRSVWDSLDNFLFGQYNFANMAYAGIHKFDSFITVFLAGILFTEPRVLMPREKKCALNRYKIGTIPLVLGTTVLIWTALYLSFTTVGGQIIDGVQGRYYLPLILPLAVIFYTDRTGSRWKMENYTMVMQLGLLVIWHVALYSNFLTAFCR